MGGVVGVSRAASALVFLSGFAMGLTPGKSGELTKSYWLREIAGPDRAPLARTAPIVFGMTLVRSVSSAAYAAVLRLSALLIGIVTRATVAAGL